MAILRARLLGGWALSWDEAPMPAIPGEAARSLLAYLLAYRERPHTRDLLAGTFWPDLPEATARRRLSRALWQIRRSLRDQDHPQQVLLTDVDTVQIHPDLPLWLDVEEFRHHAAEGGLPELELAFELYRGDLLTGYYDDWLLAEREQLQEMFLAVLERLVEGCKGRGEYERALSYARRLALEVPWREDVHHEVMRLCHLLGRSSEALKQFELCRQSLAEEFDVEPSPETVALAREIAKHSGQIPVLDLPKAPPHAGAIVLDSIEAVELPLVGRDQERGKLLVHVEALFQGLGGLVLVEGEAGVGKTRLLRTVAHDAEWRGAQVLWGEAQEAGASVPYGPLAEALAGGLSPLRAGQLAQLVDNIWLQVLIPLLPPLATYLPKLHPAPQLNPDQEGGRLAVALAHFLGGWRQIKPLLLVLENLHWTGVDTLDMLARLAPSLRERGVLLVGSYRGEDARAMPGVWQKLQALDRAGVQHRLVLSGLDAAATGELVRRSLGLGAPVPLFEARLYEETGGNPLFVLEMLRTLHGEGLLARDSDGRWSTPWDETTSDYAELPLPRAVEHTIARRLAFLSPALRQVLHLAAVLGERFDFDLLLAASEEESPRVLASLGELVQRRFLDETTSDYRFSHDKIRQVTYEGMDARERLQLHRQAARALEAIRPDRLAALAHHWTRAEVWDRAIGYHQQAGDRAQAVYANAEAVTHYSQSLDTLARLDKPPDPAQVFALRLAREEVYGLRGERAAQAEELAGLEALVQTLDEASQAQVALRQAGYAWATSDYPAAIQAAQQAIRLARIAQDVDLEAEGHRRWGQSLGQQGAFQDAQGQVETALALGRRGSSRTVEAASLLDLGTLYARQGKYDQARSYLEQALPLLRELGNRQGEGMVLNNLGSVVRYQGDYAQARAYQEQSIQIRREIGDRRGEAMVLGNLGILCRRQGRYALARRYFEQTLPILHEIGDRGAESRTFLNLGIISLDLGDYAGARVHLEKSRRMHGDIGDLSGKSTSCMHLSRVLHHQGDDQGAMERALEGLQMAQQPERGSTLIRLGQALMGLSRREKAAEAYQQALDRSRELDMPDVMTESLVGLVQVSLAGGEDPQTQLYVEKILSYLERNGLKNLDEPFAAYWTCYRALQSAGDPRAGAVLDDGHRLLQERAAWIEDEALRNSYLENVAAHRELIAAYRQQYAAQTRHVRLPRADAPTGRPLRADEYVTVTWTVAAPGDDEIQHKATRRRQHILRLLAEAQSQGAVPRGQDLAEALGVSQATIRRDRAALRAQGHNLPTRGRT